MFCIVYFKFNQTGFNVIVESIPLKFFFYSNSVGNFSLLLFNSVVFYDNTSLHYVNIYFFEKQYAKMVFQN